MLVAQIWAVSFWYFIHPHIKNSLHMKQVTLTIKEWYLFKQIANFFYEFSLNNNLIIIKADAYQLEQIGY